MIVVKGLRVTYRPAGVEAIKNVSVEIPGNTTTCVIGPNASGKTTLLRALARLLEYEGSIFIDGREIGDLGKALRKILAYVSPITANDLLGVRVVDVLLTSRYPVSHGLVDTSEDLEAIYRVVRELGIEDLLTRRISELSSGELQKVLFATALVRAPRVLLLDEPDSHLDVAVKPWLSRYLRKLSESCTVVTSTHDTVFAFYTCEYFVILSRGRVLYSGWYSDLVNDTRPLREAYGVEFVGVELGGRVVLIPAYGAEEHKSASEARRAESSVYSV